MNASPLGRVNGNETWTVERQGKTYLCQFDESGELFSVEVKVKLYNRDEPIFRRFRPQGELARALLRAICAKRKVPANS